MSLLISLLSILKASPFSDQETLVTLLLRDRAVLGLEPSSLNLRVPAFLLDELSSLFRNPLLKLSQACILACNLYD